VLKKERPEHFLTLLKFILKQKFDFRGSVHHRINYIEITNKMQPFTRIYYSNAY